MAKISGIGSQKSSKTWFQAEMNRRQFKALRIKIESGDIPNEILNNQNFGRIQKPKNLNLAEIKRLLFISWTTEKVLNLNEEIFNYQQNSFALQWTFPQVYYAYFNSILAYFFSKGETETSHRSVQKRFGLIVSANKLPNSISFYCGGTNTSLILNNINDPKLNLSTIAFDSSNHDHIDKHICQLLRATRKEDLEFKKNDFQFLNSNGKPKANLNTKDKETVSKGLGYTTILSFLYRKRIKSNYRNADLFVYEKLNAKEIFDDIKYILNKLNLVNETYVMKSIGIKDYKQILQDFIGSDTKNIFHERFSIGYDIIRNYK